MQSVVTDLSVCGNLARKHDARILRDVTEATFGEHLSIVTINGNTAIFAFSNIATASVFFERLKEIKPTTPMHTNSFKAGLWSPARLQIGDDFLCVQFRQPQLMEEPSRGEAILDETVNAMKNFKAGDDHGAAINDCLHQIVKRMVDRRSATYEINKAVFAGHVAAAREIMGLCNEWYEAEFKNKFSLSAYEEAFADTERSNKSLHGNLLHATFAGLERLREFFVREGR